MEEAGRKYLHKLLTLPGERILVAERKHWFTLVSPLSVTFFMVLSFCVASYLLFTMYLSSTVLFLTIIVAVLTVSMSLITRFIVDWYFHLYVVTNRKILEVCYVPIFSHKICDVLLDQVRCTEIDIKIGGILNEILDKGDVIVTFDRPTHEEEFIFTNVKNPKEIGHILGDSFPLIGNNPNPSFKPASIWYQDKFNGVQQERAKNFTFMEEIFPKHSVQIG